MSFIAKNPLIIPEIDSPPSLSKSGTRGLFAGKDGWYEIDSSQNVNKIATSEEVASKMEDLKKEVDYNGKEDKANKLTLADMNGDFDSLEVTDDQYLSALVAQIIHDALNQRINAVEFDLSNFYATKEDLNSKESIDNKVPVEGVKTLGLDGSKYSDDHYLSAKGAVYMANFLNDRINEIGAGGSGTSAGYNASISQHYGGTCVVPSDAELFIFIINPDEQTASVKAKSVQDISSDIVIPYECEVDGVTYRVTSIADNGFMGAEKITSITIPDSVTWIGEGAFLTCPNMVNANVYGAVTEVPGEAFRDCGNLKSITLPETITLINGMAFEGDSALTDVYFKGTEEQWKRIEFLDFTVKKAKIHCDCQVDYAPTERATRYGDSSIIPTDVSHFIAYNGSVSGYMGDIPNIIIPYKIDGIDITDIYNAAFSYNPYIKSVVIPHGVKIISAEAFLGCSELTSVTIPNSVTWIDYGAFGDCRKLKDVYFRGTEEQWNNIEKNVSVVDDLPNVTIHFNYNPALASKGYIDAKDKELQQYIYDLQADIVGREERINKTNTISQTPSMDKYPSELAVFDYGQSLINLCNSFTTGYVTQEIGNVETALENIIEKYGLGGDAS